MVNVRTVNNYKSSNKKLCYFNYSYTANNKFKTEAWKSQTYRILYFIAKGVNSVSINPQLLSLTKIPAYVSRNIHCSK